MQCNATRAKSPYAPLLKVGIGKITVICSICGSLKNAIAKPHFIVVKPN